MSASFPAALADDARLKVAKNRCLTALSAGIDDSVLVFDVANGAVIANNSLITVDDEIIAVASVAGNTVTASARGVDGTAAASHNSAALVYGYVTAWHHNAMREEMIAVQTALGVGLANIATASDLTTKANKGANSDITSLSGLTTPLTVPQGGTGAATLTGIVQGNGASAQSAVAAASPLQYLRRKPNIAGAVYEFSSSPVYHSSDYDFPAQAPAQSLVIGSNTITLSPVPLGVNWNDTNHYLYIADGVGGNEVALIVAAGPGTATSGAASGTITISCAANHTSGNWTIQSATSGIREAIAAAPAGGTVEMPSGSLLVDRLVIDKLVTLTGKGMGGTTLVPRVGVGTYVVTYHPSTLQTGSAISGFTIDLTSFPSMSGMNLQNMVFGNVHDVYVLGGTNGIVLSGPVPETPSVVYSTFYTIKLINQTGVGFLNDGDTCWENYYDNISIQNTAVTTLTAGFKVTRATAYYSGAYYLRRVHVNRVGAGNITGGFVFDSALSIHLDIFMLECVADGISGDALRLINVGGFLASHSWFASSGPAPGDGHSVVISGGTGNFTFSGNIVIADHGSNFKFLAAPANINIVNTEVAGGRDYFLLLPGGVANPTNISFAGNMLNGITFSNDPTVVYGTAYGERISSGITIWANPSGTGPDTLDVYDPVNDKHARIRNYNGTLHVLAPVISQTYNYVEDYGVANAAAGNLGNPAASPVTLASGLMVRLKVNVSLAAGANTFALNGGAAKAIKSSRNPANNIATPYTSGSIVTLVYDGTVWQDVSQ